MIEIRQGNWDDLKDLVIIRLDSLMGSKSLSDFFINEIHKRWVTSFSAGMCILILTIDQKISGFLNYYPFSKSNPHDSEICVIDNVYIVPELRNQGYGEKLVEHFLELIKPRGYSCVKVFLEDSHPIMKGFYESLGFCLSQQTEAGMECQFLLG